MGIRVIAAQGVIRGSISCNVRRTPWLLGTVSPISVLVGFPVSLIAKQEHVLGKHIKVSLPMSMADGVQQNPWVRNLRCQCGPDISDKYAEMVNSVRSHDRPHHQGKS